MSKSKEKTGNGNSEIHFVCEMCEKPIQVTLRLGELGKQIPDFDPKQTTYRQGLCGTCKSELESGCIFFTDEKSRVIKVSAEAAREKIQECYWGKIVKIPVPALTELIRVYLQSRTPQPPEK